MPDTLIGAVSQPETVLAFDFGTRRIGVAIGNSLTAAARPLCIIEEATRAGRFARIEALLTEWQPDLCVVGLPLTLEGEEQLASVHSRRFANQLHGRYGMRVALVDERNSSLEAQSLQGHHAPDDALAAAVILQRHFDAASSGSLLNPFA